MTKACARRSRRARRVIFRLAVSGQTLTVAAARAAKPAGLGLRLDPALMLGDPRLGVRFGFEQAHPGGISVRDADLDAERSVVKRDYTIARLGVGVCFWHYDAARFLTIGRADLLARRVR